MWGRTHSREAILAILKNEFALRFQNSQKFCNKCNTKRRSLFWRSLTTKLCNPLNPSGILLYHRIWHSGRISSSCKVCLCVLYGNQKSKIFHSTALTDSFLPPRQSVYCAVQIEFSNTVHINLSHLRLKFSLDIKMFTISSDLVLPK
jgi:hypothetical protein